VSHALPDRESLTVEFKSDLKKLSDSDLIAAVVCLANAQGGDLFLGVEDDGRVTGLHETHQDFETVTGLIANRTVPSLSVTASVLDFDGVRVGHLSVPLMKYPVATSDGTLLRRKIKYDGTPECTPMFAHDVIQRQTEFGMLDYSAMPVLGASVADLDPAERVRLRECIARFGGDRSLTHLEDDELDAALQLVRREQGQIVPTVTGLLLLGREAALKKYLPAHEVAVQVLAETAVEYNEFQRTPLLKTFEWLDQQYKARRVERELQVGLFRVAVPNYDERAFREAVVNALVHRDYTRLGAVHVRWETEALIISNPGGFVEGVTLENLLVVEPRPRNPALADAIKRIGLAERTGRGIDLIYRGLLQYGRSPPDYRRSSSTSVVVVLPGGDADLGLVQYLIEEEQRRGEKPGLDALIALSLMRQERRVETNRLAAAIHKDEAAARRVLERLVEWGLVDAHGVNRSRNYTLSARVYRSAGQSADYVRQAGFDKIQQETMVFKFLRTHGRITRKDVVELCRITDDQATYILRKLCEDGRLELVGKGRGAFYRAP
jgi:ATP-dependent DNA helicase RecG